MTLAEIKRSEKPFLIPTDVAEVIGCNPHTIRLKAEAGTLEFPFFRSGNRTKIPRKPFLEWLEGEREEEK